MLIHLANELDTSVSALLGDAMVDDSKNDKDLKVLSEKLEAINLQLAKRNETRIRMISLHTDGDMYTHYIGIYCDSAD